MADRFFGLWHHAIIRRNDQHGDIGYVCTPGAHFRERFVTRRIDKRDFLAVFLNVISTNMLGDPATFAADNIDSDNRVQ